MFGDVSEVFQKPNLAAILPFVNAQPPMSSLLKIDFTLWCHAFVNFSLVEHMIKLSVMSLASQVIICRQETISFLLR